MGRKLKKVKPLIYVFCEGESEQAYTDFLKKQFSDVAVIKRPSSIGLINEAKVRFDKDPRFRNSIEETDEIWFFFDVEVKDIGKWEQRIRIIKALRKLRRKPGVRVRLLMTSGCIEYWLMLHYKMYVPPVQTVADKERIAAELKTREPSYFKGDYTSTSHIAVQYPTAVINAEQTVRILLADGLPGMEDSDERNQWLYTKCKTFSTVNEAINYLEDLSGKERKV